jgi:predicted DNA-binding transcriptional regulator AlpA
MKDRLMRLPEIVGNRKLGIKGSIPCSTATFYRNIQRGVFPKASKIGRISYWKQSDIEKVIESI